MKKIAILGSTGSIGTQTLEIISEHSNKFQAEILTANNNIDLLAEQANKYNPNVVVIANEERYDELVEKIDNPDIKIYAGSKAIADVVSMSTIDIVLTAMVGFSGLEPTIEAIKAKKPIALANKETLVVAGDLITRLAAENGVPILPVDSEHSAIFQCLTGEWNNNIEKIYLTASGGPFRGFSTQQLSKVTKEDALKHPNWDMGSKITIDSATMMNKGLEAIEAKWLFNLKPEQIEIVVHPQSIIHSIVQFEDGSMKAQMGLPDMRVPIQYSLTYPERFKSSFERFNFMDYPTLSFHKPDQEVFRCIKLAYYAMQKGGNMPCILNAANEIAVEAFLNNQISFTDIPELINDSMENISFIQKPDLEDYIDTDKKTREYTKKKIS